MGAFDRFFVDSARFVGFPVFCMVNHRGLGYTKAHTFWISNSWLRYRRL